MSKDNCAGIYLMLKVDGEKFRITIACAGRVTILSDVVEAVVPLGTDIICGGAGRA